MKASYRMNARRRRLTVTALFSIGTIVIGAQAAEAQSATIRVQPLGVRQGVVVGYRAQSKTVIVAIPSGKLKAIHSLRAGRTGTRVRIRGIKWGAPVGGIKWFRAPRGIKWGIKWALNGTFSSTLDPIGTTTRARIRGIVVARSRTAIAVATKGGVVTVITPMALPAVTGSRTINATSAPRTGSIVIVPVTISGGALRASAPVSIIGTAPVVPVSGAISAISSASRTITVDGTSDPILPVEVTMAVPASIDITSLAVGDEVVAVAQRDNTGALRTTTVSPNESFAAANDPAAQIVAPPPANPVTIGLLNGLVGQVDAAVNAGQISDAAVATAAKTQIRAARTAAGDGDFPASITAIDAFVATIDAGRAAGVVAPATANRLRRLAGDVRTRLVDPAKR